MASANTVWLVSADLKRADSAKTKRNARRRFYVTWQRSIWSELAHLLTYSCDQFRSDEDVHPFQLIEALIIFRLTLMDVSN